MSMPSLFLTHGTPSLILERTRYTEFLKNVSARLPKPKAIIIVSAHWNNPVQQVSGAAQLRTLHDYEQAPEELHSFKYPAKGNIVLSLDIQRRLEAASIRAEIDDQRGLDHGAWTLLSLMYPAADIPVVALSVNDRLVPEEHYRTGRSLRGLRNQGVLLIGSGGTVTAKQPAGAFDPASKSMQAEAIRFDDWLEERIQLWDLESLFDYEKRAPLVKEATPCKAHLAPLLICMGSGEAERRGRRIYKGYQHGCLSLNGWKFG